MKDQKEQGKAANGTQGGSTELSAAFPTEALQARRERQDIRSVSVSTYKGVKEKNLQLRILYPARFSLRFDGEIKSFPEKQKLRENSAPPNQLYDKY